ncbi:FtsX-like permease family protein [Ruania albidiflava]|uniref:FtsX-like permease family protein n=1 Tax=Ruania albidiflava TaxID=366586 RepID=UPI0023F22704|nr:FtsX-like permease family protein [Ruania albidiflava]
MSNAGLAVRYVRSDLHTNPGAHLALTALLLLSAFLMATGAMVAERLVGSIDRLFEIAEPPDFLQMHRGDLDHAALDAFAAEHPEIEAWLIEEMLGFDGAAVGWQHAATGASGDLADSVMDNLFVTQNQEFDFLLDAEGAVPQPAPGQVYVPVAYQQSYDLAVGDRLTVRTDTGPHQLQVAGFVRDAQMASSMSSATRFLVSEQDFEDLEAAGGGAPEHILEYRLTDGSSAGDLQRAYEADPDLPKNGQAVTIGMIRLLNALGDGLVAVALVLGSLVLVAVAVINLRFVVRGTLEDEVREIGALRAIGISHRQISALYLGKYATLTLLACAAGGALAVPATAGLTQAMQVNYAAAPAGAATVLVPVAALGLLGTLVLLLCRQALRRVGKAPVVGALVGGSMLSERQTARRARRGAARARRHRLAAYSGTRVNTFLARLDLRADLRQWALVPVVFALLSVLMILPMNLLSTFQSPRFGTAMGAPEADLLVDLQFSPDLEDTRTGLLADLERDDRVTEVSVLATELREVPGEDGWETLRVQVGDHHDAAVQYLHGRPPGPGQVALSVLNAQRYQLAVGDTLPVRPAGPVSSTDQASPAVVSGVYQDLTMGGYTAKLPGEPNPRAAGYAIYARVTEATDPADLAAEYADRYPTASVIQMAEYLDQTMSFVTSSFRVAAGLALAFALVVAALISALFLSLQLKRERQRMGVLFAVGFSRREIVTQMRTKALAAVAVGVLGGTVAAAAGGQHLVDGVLVAAGLGITELRLFPQAWLVYGVYPALLVGVGLGVSVLTTARIRSAQMSRWLRG